MKPRKVLVTMVLKTDLPIFWLRSKSEWEIIFDSNYSENYHNDVEKVDAIRIKESK